MVECLLQFFLGTETECGEKFGHPFIAFILPPGFVRLHVFLGFVPWTISDVLWNKSDPHDDEPCSTDLFLYLSREALKKRLGNLVEIFK